MAPDPDGPATRFVRTSTVSSQVKADTRQKEFGLLDRLSRAEEKPVWKRNAIAGL